MEFHEVIKAIDILMMDDDLKFFFIRFYRLIGRLLLIWRLYDTDLFEFVRYVFLHIHPLYL